MDQWKYSRFSCGNTLNNLEITCRNQWNTHQPLHRSTNQPVSLIMVSFSHTGYMYQPIRGDDTTIRRPFVNASLASFCNTIICRCLLRFQGLFLMLLRLYLAIWCIVHHFTAFLDHSDLLLWMQSYRIHRRWQRSSTLSVLVFPQKCFTTGQCPLCAPVI